MPRYDLEHDEGGYGRCPGCKRRVWTESGCAFECPCGFGEHQPETPEASE